MASQSNDKLARSLLDPSGREVLWPIVFAGVKNVVRANNLNSDTLTCIKGWLKANDNQLHIPLLALTVLHTMSLNCSTAVRNQMSTPKLLQRLEKQLAKPQGPQVATALVQVLVDWVYLFGQEELGVRSQALLDQPRFRQMAVGCTPSQAVLAMREELQLGLPPVAPIRGEDFIRWMYRGASLTDRTPSLAAGSSSGGGSGFAGWPSVLSGGLPGGAPPSINSAAVPELCQRMQADAQRMTSALAACRTAARMERQTELTVAMDAAYREAERCSQWRRRVQDFTQRCDDPLGLSAVLTATDVINQALQNWQHFTGHEVYDTLRIAVPPPSAEMLRRTAAAASGNGVRPPQGAPGGRGSELADLLGMGHAAAAAASGAASTANTAAAVAPLLPQQRQPQPPTATGGNPFASARPLAGGSSQLSNNPFAVPAAASQPARAPAVHSAAKDWDPFAPAPPAAPAQPQAQASSTSSFAAAASGSGGGGNGWTAFPLDPGGVSWSGPQSPSMAMTSPQASGTVFSPSGASTASVASTPSGGAAAASSAALAISSPRPPPPGVSYLQPFHDLLAPVAPAATPQQAATAATAGGGVAAASSGHSAVALSANSHGANGHAYAYAAANAAGAAAAGGAYPQVSSAAAGRSGAIRSTSSSGDGAAPVLDWQPEFERLAAELRSLWAASSPGLSPSPSSSSLAAAAANGGGAAPPPPLPAVLARVKGMCEALAAQHARQVAALAPQLQAFSLSEAALSRDVSNGWLTKLREVASASAAAGATGYAAEGAGPQGAGNGAGAAAGAGPGGWVGFGGGGRAQQPMGPLQQHLMQQQQPQQLRSNGAVPGSGRIDSLI